MIRILLGLSKYSFRSLYEDDHHAFPFSYDGTILR